MKKEPLFLVCNECGEAFAIPPTAYDNLEIVDRHQHRADHGPDTTWKVLPESEAF